MSASSLAHDFHHPQQNAQQTSDPIAVSALSAAANTSVKPQGAVSTSGVTANTQQALSFLDRIAIQNQQQQRGTTNSAPIAPIQRTLGTTPLQPRVVVAATSVLPTHQRPGSAR